MQITTKLLLTIRLYLGFNQLVAAEKHLPIVRTDVAVRDLASTLDFI